MSDYARKIPQQYFERGGRHSGSLPSNAYPCEQIGQHYLEPGKPPFCFNSITVVICYIYVLNYFHVLNCG